MAEEDNLRVSLSVAALWLSLLPWDCLFGGDMFRETFSTPLLFSSTAFSSEGFFSLDLEEMAWFPDLGTKAEKCGFLLGLLDALAL